MTGGKWGQLGGPSRVCEHYSRPKKSDGAKLFPKERNSAISPCAAVERWGVGTNRALDTCKGDLHFPETVTQVPMGRYFLLVGSALLALLFVSDLYLPRHPTSFAREAQIDKTIIRVMSSHRWPEKIMYDTTLPTIVPQPNATIAEATSATPDVRNSFANLVSVHPVPKSSLAPKRKVVRRTRLAYRVPPAQFEPSEQR